MNIKPVKHHLPRNGAVSGNTVWFTDDPPDPCVFAHELVHLAGVVDERWARTVQLAVDFAAKRGVEPFDATKLVNLRLEDLDAVARELGFSDILDALVFASGHFPDVVADLVARKRLGQQESTAVLRILQEIVSGAEGGEPLFVLLFSKIAEKLRATSTGSMGLVS